MNTRTKGIGLAFVALALTTVGLLGWLAWPSRDRDREQLPLPKLGAADDRAQAAETRIPGQAPGPALEIWPPRPPGQQVWALVAGVQRYEDPAIPARPGLMQDARTVYRWLINNAGWNEQNILLLDDDGVDTPEHLVDAEFKILKPNRYNLRWALQYWLDDDRVRPGDLILIYFAGQAVTLPVAANAPPGTLPRELLLPSDARLNELARSPEQTGWGLEELLDRFAAKGEFPIVCWLDVSLTQPRPSRIGLPQNKNLTDANADPIWGDRLLNRLTRWPGVTAWLDAAPNADEADREGLAPGAFTSALIQSLGTEQEPAPLLESLTRLQADPGLKARGFRSRGGVDPRLSIWKAEYQALPSPSPSEPVLQRAHANPVTSIQFTADGQRLITAGREAAIKVWEGRPNDWRVRYVQSEHTNEVTAMAIGPEGRWLASADGDGLVLLKDLTAFEKSITTGPPLEGNTGVVSLDFLPKGRGFVSLHRNGLCRLWPVDRPAQDVRTVAESASAMVSLPPRVHAPQNPGDSNSCAFVLAIDADEKGEPGQVLRRFDSEGRPIGADLAGPGGGIAAGGLVTDGQILAAIDTAGRLMVLEIKDGQTIYETKLEGEPRHLAISPSGRWLAVALRNTSRLDLIDLRQGPEAAAFPLSIDGDCRHLAFSTDERWLAAVSAFGPLPAVWALSAEAENENENEKASLLEPKALSEAGSGRAVPLQTLAFSPDNRCLLAGDEAGGLLAWNLPDGTAGQYLAPHRGQVDALAVSADGRHLIQVTHDRLALLWDLQEGRTVRALPGRWTSSAFLPAGLQVVLTDHPDGNVVVLDLEAINPRTGRPQTRVLDRPALGPRREVDLVSKFGPLAVSADGLRIASGALDAPLACVWEVDSGQVLHVVGPQDHFGPIASVDLSADGRLLLTAGRDDGQAKLWDLAQEENQAPRERAVCELIDEQGDAVPILSARLRPTADQNQDQNQDQDQDQAWQVALGLGDGRTLLWGSETEKPIDLGQRLFGAVEAMTFTPEGNWLVASGIDKRLRVWQLDGQAPRTARLGPPDPFEPTQIKSGPHHSEAIRTLIAWPDAERPIVASGSLDATIRLWRLDQGKLLGTLTAEQRGTEPEREREREQDQEQEQELAGPLAPMPWLAFTPFGHFDGSPDGDGLVHFIQDGRLVPPEQYPEPFRVFRLTDQLRQGEAPAPPGPLSTPPKLVLEPPDGPLKGGREVALTIHALGDVPVEGLRLFQDGVPILSGPEAFETLPSGGWVAKVRLRGQGEPNRFYSMAGQAGGFDGRSNEVELRYQGDDPESDGLLHMLALGISDYAVPSRVLPYAKDDANQLSETLRRISLSNDSRSEAQKALDKENGREPQILVLTNQDVTSAKVATAFQEIRKAIQGHPEDTVVVLLAGHADALIGSPTPDQEDPSASYFMILPEFPFPVGPGPIPPAQARTLLLEQRGRKDPETLLAFSEIYRHFLHLGARNRLVIVDACGAETIRQDARVQRLQELVDQGAYRSRTDYILASRRGEPAGEATALRQGLLTYTLLRGLGRDDLPAAPNVSVFETLPNADLNRNGYLTTDELRRYVEQALPALAQQFPLMVQRSGVGGPAESNAEAEANPSDQQLQIQAASASTGFTLFPLPVTAPETDTVAD
jgi:WD40 repeat protein